MTVCGSLATSVILGDSYGIHHRHAPDDIALLICLPDQFALYLSLWIAGSLCCFVRDFVLVSNVVSNFIPRSPLLQVLFFEALFLLLTLWMVAAWMTLGCGALFRGAVPKRRLHSSKDIAILRSAENVFYFWDEEKDQKKLDQKFADSDITNVVLIRRVRDDQVVDLNLEPLPLLHVEIAYNPNKDISDDSTDSTNLMQWISTDGIWTDSTIGGASFSIHIYPVCKLNEEGNFVDHGTDWGALVCGWKVYSGIFAKLEKRLHSCKRWPEEAEALLNSRVPSLQNCASFAVLQQHGNTAGKKMGDLPRCVIETLNGQ